MIDGVYTTSSSKDDNLALERAPDEDQATPTQTCAGVATGPSAPPSASIGISSPDEATARGGGNAMGSRQKPVIGDGLPLPADIQEAIDRLYGWRARLRALLLAWACAVVPVVAFFLILVTGLEADRLVATGHPIAGYCLFGVACLPPVLAALAARCLLLWMNRKWEGQRRG